MLNGDDQRVIVVRVDAKGVLFSEKTMLTLIVPVTFPRKLWDMMFTINTCFVYILRAALERSLLEIPLVMVLASRVRLVPLPHVRDFTIC